MNILKYILTFLKYTLIFIVSFFIVLIGFLFYADSFMPEWNGSYKLGKGLFLIEWDWNTQKIVYSGETESNGYGGRYIIPPFPDSPWICMHEVNANDLWVIVKATTLKGNYPRYYLIDKSFNIEGLDWKADNCDSIIQSHIIVTSDSIRFEEILKKKNVDLRFNNIRYKYMYRREEGCRTDLCRTFLRRRIGCRQFIKDKQKCHYIQPGCPYKENHEKLGFDTFYKQRTNYKHCHKGRNSICLAKQSRTVSYRRNTDHKHIPDSILITSIMAKYSAKDEKPLHQYNNPTIGKRRKPDSHKGVYQKEKSSKKDTETIR